MNIEKSHIISRNTKIDYIINEGVTLTQIPYLYFWYTVNLFMRVKTREGAIKRPRNNY